MYSQNPDFDYDGEEEFYDNPLLTGGRRGTIFIVDIGKKMFERDEHNDYYIKKAMVQMRDYLNALALSGSMVERVCIIFINAPPNAPGFMQGSVVFYPRQGHELLDNITAELVQEVNEFIDADDIKQKFVEKFGVGVSSVDMFELLHTCERYFAEDKALQKVVNIYSRNLPLEPSKDVQKRLEDRIATLNKNLHLYAFLVDFPVNCQPDPYWEILDPEYKLRPEAPKPNTIFPDTTFRASSRIPFLLGQEVEIPVAVYTLVRERSAPTYVHVDRQTNEPVERSAFFVKKSNEEKAEPQDSNIPLSVLMNQETKDDEKNGISLSNRLDVKQSELCRKTELGGRDVILNSSEFEALRRVEPSGIRLIGFKRMSTLKESHRMGESYYLYPIEDLVVNSTKLFTSLYKTCIEKEVYALARITFRGNMAPRMCALVPQSRLNLDADEQPPYAAYLYEGFHAITLPFMQDKRNLQDLYKQEDRLLASTNEPILRPVKRLVERLTSDYVPDKFVNPRVQGHYRMIECLALQYDVDESKKQLGQCELDRRPFYENEGLKGELADELQEIRSIISGADPSNETLAKKRRQGTTSTRSQGAKRGRTT